MGATLLAFGRMIIVLAFIIGLLLLMSRFAQKYQHKVTSKMRIGAPAGIEVISRRSLGKHSAILVIRVSQKIFLVSHSAQQISLLAELEGADLEFSDSAEVQPTFSADKLLAPRTASIGRDSSGAWDAFLYRLREKTVRH